MTNLYVGLDGEMSGNDIGSGSALIQIGFAVVGESFNRYPWYIQNLNPGVMDWQPEAAAVHKITEEEVSGFPDPCTADDNCFKWLVSQGADPGRRMKTIPVGFNVGAFDMPFVREFLPRTNSLFSRRTIDLNAICFALGEARQKGGKSLGMGYFKSEAKEWADNILINEVPISITTDWRPHNAAYDAYQGLLCFQYLSSLMK